ncbi:hypothetical protein QYF36_015119 [Acer negundo]|nr:hypothetical protein QYF36_015119 [Acer negundo]
MKETKDLVETMIELAEGEEVLVTPRVLGTGEVQAEAITKVADGTGMVDQGLEVEEEQDGNYDYPNARFSSMVNKRVGFSNQVTLAILAPGFFGGGIPRLRLQKCHAGSSSIEDVVGN